MTAASPSSCRPHRRILPDLTAVLTPLTLSPLGPLILLSDQCISLSSPRPNPSFPSPAVAPSFPRATPEPPRAPHRAPLSSDDSPSRYLSHFSLRAHPHPAGTAAPPPVHPRLPQPRRRPRSPQLPAPTTLSFSSLPREGREGGPRSTPARTHRQRRIGGAAWEPEFLPPTMVHGDQVAPTAGLQRTTPWERKACCVVLLLGRTPWTSLLCFCSSPIHQGDGFDINRTSWWVPTADHNHDQCTVTWTSPRLAEARQRPSRIEGISGATECKGGACASLLKLLALAVWCW